MLPKLLPVIVVICLLYSCHTKPEKPLIKTRFYIHKLKIIDDRMPNMDTTFITNGPDYTYTYDDQGKILSTVSSAGTKMSWSKEGSKLITITTDSTGKIISKKTEFQNEKGLTDSFFVGQNGRVTDARKFFYDAQDNKIKDCTYEWNNVWKELRLSVTWTYNWKDSNLVSEVTDIPGSTDTIMMVNPVTLKMDTMIQHIDNQHATTYFEYFTDKLNTAHGNTNSKNLIRQSVEVSAKGDTTAVKNYRYTFDDKGRVLTEVFESAPGYKDGTTTELEYDSTAYSYY